MSIVLRQQHKTRLGDGGSPPLELWLPWIRTLNDVRAQLGADTNSYVGQNENSVQWNEAEEMHVT
jgi:hypothetical protein